MRATDNVEADEKTPQNKSQRKEKEERRLSHVFSGSRYVQKSSRQRVFCSALACVAFYKQCTEASEERQQVAKSSSDKQGRKSANFM